LSPTGVNASRSGRARGRNLFSRHPRRHPCCCLRRPKLPIRIPRELLRFHPTSTMRCRPMRNYFPDPQGTRCLPSRCLHRCRRSRTSPGPARSLELYPTSRLRRRQKFPLRWCCLIRTQDLDPRSRNRLLRAPSSKCSDAARESASRHLTQIPDPRDRKLHPSPRCRPHPRHCHRKLTDGQRAIRRPERGPGSPLRRP
jgi:hypothetical protein